MEVKQILIVDDHPSVGEGTKSMLEQVSDFQVTFTYSGRDAICIAEKKRFDLYLLDLHMPQMNGLELTRTIRTLHQEAVILIYSGYDIIPHFNFLVEAGISGFIDKTSSRDQLITTVRCAMRGEAVLPVELFRQLRRMNPVLPPSAHRPEGSLTAREQIILQEIARGKSNKEIAFSIHLSQRTIEYDISNIFSKLGVNSRAEAVEKAREQGLLSVQSL